MDIPASYVLCARACVVCESERNTSILEKLTANYSTSYIRRFYTKNITQEQKSEKTEINSTGSLR